MLLNCHIARFVLGSLCVGVLVRLGLSSIRVAGCKLVFFSSAIPNSNLEALPLQPTYWAPYCSVC
jgi:hypothetical protein